MPTGIFVRSPQWKTWSGSFFVLFQEEKIFSSHWLRVLIPYFSRISLTSTIASGRTVEIIPMEEKSKLGMHLTG